MRCEKREIWFNPLFIAPDNDLSNCREIHAFYVFDKTGVILKHERGWFSENSGFEIRGLACVKKNKADFNCKTAFLITHLDISNERQWDVYIPTEALGLKAPIYKKNGKEIIKTVETKIDTVKFTEYKFLDRELWNVRSKVEKCAENLDYHLVNNIDVFNGKLKELKKLSQQYKKEIEKINNYTIEMAIAEGF